MSVAARPVPADRLGKLPRRVTVGIYADDQLAVAHDQAAAALAAAEERTEASRGRRVAAGKTASGADLPSLDRDERVALAAGVVERVDAEIDAELAPLRAAADETLAALDAATIWLTFRAIGRARWRELLEAHPPTDADHEAAVADSGNEKARASWNAEGLAPVLLEVASVGRVLDGEQLGPLTADDVTEIFTGGAWNETEINALFVTALTAQTQGRAVTHRPAPTAAALEGSG